MRLLCFVPAKGTSERFPGKNLHEFLGRPLVDWTFEFLHLLNEHGHEVTQIVVTDDPDIERFHAYYSSLASVRLEPNGRALLDVVEAFQKLDGEEELRADKFDVIGMFLPTAPFREMNDLLTALKRMEMESDVDGIISVSEYEFPPSLAVLGTGEDGLDLVFPHQYLQADTRSQDQPTAYRPNGQFYLARTDRFRSTKTFFQGHIKGHPIPRERIVDIDYKEDSENAQSNLGDKIREAAERWKPREAAE